MWLNEADEYNDPQLKKDYALVIEEILKQRIQGVKNEVGAWVAPSFPKLLYVLSENNIEKSQEYYYLTELAAECSIKRMVPDYISEKVMKELKEDNVYGCMGSVIGTGKIVYKIENRLYIETFNEMWDRLIRIFGEKCIELQKNSQMNDEFINLSDKNVVVYDTKLQDFTKVFNINRNKMKNFVKVKLTKRSEIFTDDHLFTIEDQNEPIMAKNLKPGMKIEVNTNYYTIYGGKEYFDNKKYARSYELVKEVVKLDNCILNKEGWQYCFDLSTESEHFEVSGIYTHNCRSFLSVWRDENKKPKFWGRYNKGVCTINLPDVALTAKKDNIDFWKLLDERLEACHEMMKITIEKCLKGTVSDVAPILWQHGGLARLQPGETIDKTLTGGYSTTSLGYVGLHETLIALTGKSHTEPENHELAIKIVKYMKEKCDEWNKIEDYGYSLYGTPEESTTYKFAKALRKRHGVIKGITDKNYIINSYHFSVSEPVDAFSKLSFESEFQVFTNGGAISYVETPNMDHNPEAVLAVMKHIYEHIMYAEINCELDYCMKCGHNHIIIEENGDKKLIWKCEKCGNTDLSKMNIVRRVCGYLSSANYMNQGRMGDIKDRVKHL